MILVKPDKKGIELAVKYLQLGKSVVYPTETSYGLGVDATNLAAVKRLYRIKERSYKQPVHVIVSSLAQAKKIAKFSPLAAKIFNKFLPGPLTLILPLLSPLRLPLYKGEKIKGTPSPREKKSWGILSGGTGTIGIRMPNNLIALELLKKFSEPITTTSANPSAHLSGGRDSYSAQDVIKQFCKKKYQPDLIIDAGVLPKRKPSTMISIKDEKIRLIRKGPIKYKVILNVVKDL